MRILKTIGAGIGVVASLFYVGCGSVPTAEAGIPVIAQIVPQSITTGTSDATVEVVGSNFTSQTVVLWNGSELATAVINDTTLAGTVAASNLTVPGTAELQLQNNITGQRSAPMPIKITSPVATTSLTMTTTSLPPAAVGAPYSVTLAATGGTPSYTWQLTSGRMPNGLALSSSTGILSGTPTVAGSYSLGITVSDRSNPTQEKLAALTLVVAAANSLNITTTSLPSTTAGTPYSQTLVASGGTPVYSWSISSGSLPAGLTLTSTGTISGTPTVGGTFSFNATVTDQSTPVQTRTAALTITVAAAASPLKITTSALAAGTVGTAYSQSLSASGGTPAYTWKIASGSLPTGLMLGSSGAISGTPTASGTFSFGVTASDSSSPKQTLTAALSITVAAVPLRITTSALAGGEIGAGYSQTLSASGGTPAYTWSLASGNLPTGLTLASTGAISGTPSATGTSSFTATVRDSGNPAQTQSVTLSITIAATPLKITAAALAQATYGRSYMQSLQATGGTPGYTWTIASGSLPAGLTLASTGAISGTPTASGSSTFTASVHDSGSPLQTVSAALTISVAPAPITITASTLPTVTAGSAYSQMLHATGGTTPYTWSIKAGQLPTGLSLSSSTGVISGAPITSGTANFTAMVADSSNPTQTASLAMTLVVAASQVAPVIPPVQPAKLTVAGSTLAAGTIGAAYSQTLSASGGTTPYSWAVTSGQLPAGLSLSTVTGAITGTASASDAAGGYNFAVTVTDSSSPAQTATASTSITLSATPLSITSSALAAGTDGTAYSQTLQAAGGTPAYSWSISSGSLPAGLTLSTTTGAITGMPTGSGTSSFAATVTDNGIPAQSQSVTTSITVSTAQTGTGTLWYIRPDGGTRYDANVSTGQCNGQANAPYPGTGVNQACAFNDVRFLWQDQSYGNNAWVINGGDTVYIFGCAANANQPQSYSPHCRIGFDNNTGPGAGYTWCVGLNGPYSCFNPTIPAGTATNHTKIYGGCVLSGNCNTGNTTNRSNLATLFGGFGVGNVLNLAGTQYVDVQGLEITSHSQAVPGTNGICMTHGSPSYPAPCSSGSPMSDYDSNGIGMNASTANVTLTDVWIDGNSTSGIAGPIGANITLTRVQINFNGFAGWNFDDGSDDPNGPNASLTLHYVTLEGNGCNQQWPITNPTFPAVSCYDLLSGGFGDSLSGQDAQLVSLTADHYVAIYNTKDGFIGPHTQVGTLTITDSQSYANNGQQWKWGATNTVFENNYTGGYYSLMAQIPGAAQNFNESTGLRGSYLSDYARAAGDVFSFYSTPGGSILIANNTTVTYASTIFDENQCSTGLGNCSNVVIKYDNNINLGYTVPLNYYPGAGGEAPGLYYPSDTYIRQPSNNVEFGVRNGNCGTTGGTGMVCTDPKLTNEPAQGSVPPESTLFNFNFYPASGSPTAGAGLSISGLTTDFYGVTRPSPPSIGAAEPQ